jgi:hypothetical protein
MQQCAGPYCEALQTEIPYKREGEGLCVVVVAS